MTGPAGVRSGRREAALAAAACAWLVAGCVSGPRTEVPTEPVASELTAWQKVSNVATFPFRLAGACVYYPLRFVCWDAWVGLAGWLAPADPEAAALAAATTPADRVAALRRLATARRLDLAPACVPLLADPDGEVRAAAATALVTLDARAQAPAVAALLRDARTAGPAVAAADALAALAGREAWGDLATALRASGAGDAAHAAALAHALGRLRAPEGAWALIATLGHPAAPVRQQAAWALGEVGYPPSAPFLAPLLSDPAPEVRAAACHAVARLGDTSLAPLLARALGAGIPADAGEALVVAAAAHGLGRLAATGSGPALLALCQAPPTEHPWDPVLRATAAQALGRLGDLSAAPVLAEMLRDADARVARTAGEALAALGAEPALLAGLADPRAGTREAAAVGLGRCATPASAASLVERAGADRDAVVRHAAARALLARGDGRALDLLTRELQRGGLEARAAARALLVQVAGEDLGPDPDRWVAWREGPGATVDLRRFAPRVPGATP